MRKSELTFDTVVLYNEALAAEQLSASSEASDENVILWLDFEKPDVRGELIGDVDGDGIVTISDALILAESVFNGIYHEKGDLNGDCKITLIDVICVIILIVKR